MTRFVLDTDMLSLLQRGHRTVATHVGFHPGEVATTIISVEEQLSGWYTLLRRARLAKDLVPVYERMSETVRPFGRLPPLTFGDAAAEHYERLLKQKRRTGRMDLRIAAIALAHRAAVVTRNVTDFLDIEDLLVLDWSRQPSSSYPDTWRDRKLQKPDRGHHGACL